MTDQAAQRSSPQAESSLDHSAFRAELAAFFDGELSDRIREAGKKSTSLFSPYDQAMEFHRALYEKGWGAVNWPLEYGGTGWTLDQQRVFHEECRLRELPFLLPNSLQMVGPVLMKFGTEEQKQRYLPGILAGQDYWTQGYSEPGAGSDLVALKCRADRDGDDYVINGSKIWTTLANQANRMFMLVRTDFDCKPQRGITFLLLDTLDLPGLTVREIIGLDGFPEQCEVFFDNVRVPVSARLGEENDGWSVAKYLLVHERGSTTSSGIIMRTELQRANRLAAEIGDGFGGKLIDDAVYQQRFAELLLEASTVDALEAKMFSLDKDNPESGPFSSLNKVAWTESLVSVCEFVVDVCGTLSLPMQLAALEVGRGVEPLGAEDVLTVMPKYLNHRAAKIFAGSNEIQKEIIAKAILDQ